MTYNERIIFIDNFYKKYCCQILETKGKEYSVSNEDVNNNFKRLAVELDIPPEKVLFIYMKKHWDAITNRIKTGRVESEPIETRIADLINYAFILASLLEETK